MMNALVYGGPGNKSWEKVPLPELHDPEDAIVRVDAVTICGTDLHILKGDVPEVTPGRILGHEAVGTVLEIGSGVRQVAVGDRVLVSCISGCGRCRYCRAGSYGQCLGGGGWVLGHTIDGTQAEFVRVPFAENSLYAIPDAVSDDDALMLADITPTAYEVGVLNGGIRPGDSVVVVGAGPIGLSAINAAHLFSPGYVLAVDLAPSRLAAAREFGAHATALPDEAASLLHQHTDGLGADVVIEAVGVPETFQLCTELVRPGGSVANIGVHGKPATLHLETLWSRNVTITTGLVDTYSTRTLLAMLAAGQLSTHQLVTHRFHIDDMTKAYETFAEAATSGALKVTLNRD